MPDATDIAYEEFEKKEQSPIRKFSKALSTKQLFYIVAIVGIGTYFIFIKKVFTTTQGIFFGAILAFIIYILIIKKDDEGHLISPEEAQAIIMIYAKKKQAEGVLPQGTIILMPDYILKRIEGEYNTYFISLEIRGYDRKLKRYIGKVHPMTGAPMGFIEKPEGIDMGKVTDVRYIPTKEEKWRREGYEFH